MTNFDHVTHLLNRYVERGLPGCSCAVARKGETLYQGYAGMADLESARPVREDTVFRIHSMSKVITCTAALMLYEQGMFLLSDPLSEYIPEFRDHSVYVPNTFDQTPARAKNPILIRHVFTMAMGLPYAGDSSPTERWLENEISKLKKNSMDLLTAVREMAKAPMAFEPGEHFLYGFCHDVLGALVEVISGKKISDFLQERIFDPLGMKDTSFRLKGDMAQRLATMYRWEDGEQCPVKDMDENYQPDAVFESPGGGLLSTLGDYLAFTQMLANGGRHGKEQLIGKNTIDLMRANQLGGQQLADFQRTVNFTGYGYGLGVRTLLDPAKAGAPCPAGEFGWDGMAGAYNSIHPDLGVSIVYMHQILPNQSEYHHLRLRNAVYGCLGEE